MNIKELAGLIKDPDIMMASDGTMSAAFNGYTDTGCYALNAALSGTIYGGIPNNRVLAFAGEESTGKTFFQLGILAHFLRQPNTGAHISDTEAAIDEDLLSSRGIDPDQVMIAEPDTIEQFRTKLLKFVTAYEKIPPADRPRMIAVLDSLGNLSSDKEVADIEEGKSTRDMTKQQLLRGTFRVLTKKLARCQIPLIVTNHTYEVVGAYIPTKAMSGGGGLKYAASIIAFLSKRRDKDGTDVVGNIITVHITKSRLTREGSKVHVKLDYDTGLDRYYGLTEIAESAGLFKKVGNMLQLPDGSKAFEKTINNNPEKYFTKEVLDQIDVAARAMFCYGKAEEADLDEELEDLENDHI